MASFSSSSSTTSSINFDRTVTKATTVGSNANQVRKVRVVAKIRGFGDHEAGFQNGVSWISVNKPGGEASGSVTVAFGDQSASRKDSYELDYCYDQNEDNDLVFSQEVKPLVSGVFDGCNATVFAFGARSTGKTCLIQGSCEKPGLATLAMAEILSAAEESGKSVAISHFEVCQDRVCDLLDSKQQAVFVLEDKQGKIQLKGLSQVPVRSISDFQKLYVEQSSSKPPQKTTIELPRRSHKGLIVYISSPDDTLRTRKMNFVELAGYEDVRRKSTDGLNFSEQSKTNTSVYAFLNVIHALSTNISHVPYRESKLARILQDSLGGSNKVLMINCLSPTFCQDSLYMVKLASRSSQKINSVVFDSTKKVHNFTTTKKMVSSIKSQTPKTISATTRKLAASVLRVPLSEKKVNSAASFAVKGRKLFDEKSKSKPSDKNTSIQTVSSVSDSVFAEDVNSVENVTDTTVSTGNEIALPDVLKKTETTFTMEKGNDISSDSENGQFTFMLPKDVTKVGADEPEAITPSFDINTKTNSSSLVGEGQVIEKDINDTPQITARLRELSNSLKAIHSATRFSVETTGKNEANVLDHIDAVEPKTPVIERNVITESRSNYKNFNSPWETPSVRGMKSSIVQEYLKFLNTADKEELKRLRGIGEKRATWILELRDESPEPFKSVDDLKNIGLAGKQIKEMMRMDGPLFD